MKHSTYISTIIVVLSCPILSAMQKQQLYTQYLLNGQLYKAKEPNGTQTIESLIENKADINAQKKGYHTPLALASIHKNIPLTKALLQLGAHINTVTGHNCTPLFYSIHNHCTELCKILVVSKADLEIRDAFDGKTALAHAVVSGKKEIVKLLLQNNANLDTCDSYGNTIFQLSKTPEVTHLLVAKHINRALPNTLTDQCWHLIAQYYGDTLTISAP